MLNRWVLSRDWKTAMEGAEVTRSGRLFQTRAAATGKARSPTVDSRVRLRISDEDELERSSRRASTSVTWQSSLVRYAGADPWRHLYSRTAHMNAIRLYVCFRLSVSSCDPTFPILSALAYTLQTTGLFYQPTCDWCLPGLLFLPAIIAFSYDCIIFTQFSFWCCKFSFLFYIFIYL